MLKMLFVSMFAVGAGWAAVSFASKTPMFDKAHERPARELSAGECQVDIGYGRMTPGNRCYYRDEVVTGAQSGYLLCSQVRVLCP